MFLKSLTISTSCILNSRKLDVRIFCFSLIKNILFFFDVIGKLLNLCLFYLWTDTCSAPHVVPQKR